MAKRERKAPSAEKERARRAMARRRLLDRLREAQRLRRLSAGDSLRLLSDLNESLLRIRGRSR